MVVRNGDSIWDDTGKGGRTHEKIFNKALADALGRTTARWKTDPDVFQVEQSQTLVESGGLMPDILFGDSETPPLIIETSVSEANAEGDAIRKINTTTRHQGYEISTVIAVAFSEDFLNMPQSMMVPSLLEGRTIRYAMIQSVHGRKRRFPKSGFIDGTVFDLANMILASTLPKESAVEVSEKVACFVNQAANRLDELESEQRRKIAELVKQRTWLKASRTMMVLWLNALLTQQQLSEQKANGVPEIKFSYDSLPDPVEQATIWRHIFDTNWRTIFGPAVEALEGMANTAYSPASEALDHLVKAVKIIKCARLGRHINVGSELFPKLSEDRSEAAAFYTEPSTAEMLVGLAISEDDLPKKEWSSDEIFRTHVMADMACGTGTLLRAGYRRVLSFYERNGVTLDGVRSFHTGAMEHGIVGTDIFSIAAHLTASSLAAIGYGEPYGDTNIWWLSLGNNGQTGALEYLDTSAMSDLFGTSFGQMSGGQTETRHVSAKIPDGSLDWVLMNPPYSRTRGGRSTFDIAGLTKKEKKACQARWGKLVRNEPANVQAGMAASFIVLAGKKIRPGGKIGFVLPLTAAFADTWDVTRRYIELKFTNISAVAVAGGHREGSLSADTHMSEMLLVATKRQTDSGSDQALIRCVTLKRSPARVGEAGEMARSIMDSLANVEDENGASRPVTIGSDEIGLVNVFDAGGEGGPWGPLGALNTDLALAADDLSKGILRFMNDQSIKLGVSMATINDVFNVGPSHDSIGHPSGGSIRGAFEMHVVTGPSDAIGSDRSLWKANAVSQSKLIVLPTHKGVMTRGVGSEEKRDRMRKLDSSLFYARGFRWTSQALLAATTEKCVMGGRAWTTLFHADGRVLKAAALWINSTFGLMVHWTQGQRTQIGRSSTQVGAIKKMPFPRLDRLDDTVLDTASKSFDGLSTHKLRPACQAHVDEVRHRIDDAVTGMLGLPDGVSNELDNLRMLLCKEPTVHGHNKDALKLLEET